MEHSRQEKHGLLLRAALDRCLKEKKEPQVGSLRVQKNVAAELCELGSRRM